MPSQTSAVSSRRALLAAAAGGLGALVAAALGRPGGTSAAAGDTMKLGQANDSGTAQTTLSNAGLGAAFTLKTTNTATNASGIFGWSSSSGGNATRGVYGKADGPNSYGVFGRQSGTAASGAAVFAEGNANDGLIGTSTNPDRYGVKGLAPGTGVYGEATSSLGQTAGVLGVAAGQDPSSGVLGVGSGTAAGIRGMSDDSWGIEGISASWIAIYGHTTGGFGAAVYGSAIEGSGVAGASTNSVGVAGASGISHGVSGYSESGYGVHGSSGSSYAGYFAGPVYVSGLLTKGGGGFRIDHPHDPAGRYLSHSFVESPDMKNVYDGRVVLDGDGEATIELPGYFETLNRDVRYQLTPLGAGAPGLHVKAEAAKGRFVIGGGVPGQEVCWQVTGIRRDAFAETHRIVAEEVKPVAERGLYLHPELYGQPEQLGLGYTPRIIDPERAATR